MVGDDMLLLLWNIMRDAGATSGLMFVLLQFGLHLVTISRTH